MAPITPDITLALNRDCQCRTLNAALLHRHLEEYEGLGGMWQVLAETRPHLFSPTAVFLSEAVVQQVHAAVAALTRVMTLRPYEAAALARATTIAHHDFGPLGVFMGYDFHLSPQGPKLIEVNTNAGGALINTILARAHQACCEALDQAFKPSPAPAQLEDTFFEMFVNEWRRQRGAQPLATLAIVDDAPDQQYLAPEFALFREMFRQRGVQADVVDGAALACHDGRLWHAGAPIDMVYNRLTDFDLSEPRHVALRSAYEAAQVVLTPHPRAHALYADKRNLAVLSDGRLLAQWGVDEADRQILGAVVPRTVEVDRASSDELWAMRRHLFFKPTGGYGAKGAYRGDKLTRKVWQAIQTGGYIAQSLIAPGERVVDVDGLRSELKFDLRAYAYAGQVQLMAARIYQGQTTNFRTPGGGFAPVIVLPS